MGTASDGTLPRDLMPSCNVLSTEEEQRIDCPEPMYGGDTAHLGCDYIHDVCSDGYPIGGNDFWNRVKYPMIGRGGEAWLYGRNFDAYKRAMSAGAKDRVFEMKTWAWSTYPMIAQSKRLEQTIEEIKKDIAVAKMCGLSYEFVVSDKPFFQALLKERADNGAFPADDADFLLTYAATCDAKSPDGSDPDR